MNWGDVLEEENEEIPQENLTDNTIVSNKSETSKPVPKYLHSEREWKLVKKVFKHESFLDIKEDRFYKRVGNCIIQFYTVPETETNVNRAFIHNRFFAKYRASCLWCYCIFDMSMKKFIARIEHEFVDNETMEIHPIVYEVKTLIKPDKWNSKDLDTVCTSGIHVFFTLEAAFCYQPNFYSIYFKKDGIIRCVDPSGNYEKSKDWKDWLFPSIMDAIPIESM